MTALTSTNPFSDALGEIERDTVSITDETNTGASGQVNGRPLRNDAAPASTTEAAEISRTAGLTSKNAESKRVARLRAEVAEAREVLALQTDPALTEADTNRVLTERVKAAEAFKLHTLSQDPARKALRDNRVRRGIAIVGGVGLVGALGWSVANVQAAVANGQHLSSADPAWWLAFLVEPMVSIGLLLIFGVRAYIAATRGITIVDTTLRRVEIALLAITLTVNSWDYLPWEASPFDALELLVHSIGPVVAVLLVTVIPVLWSYVSDTAEEGVADPDLARWTALARQLIGDGVLSPIASKTAVEKTLREHGGRISTMTANRVYKCLYGRARV
jgi:hypothetical protein